MTTTTTPSRLDMAALGKAVDAALAESQQPEPPTRPALPHIDPTCTLEDAIDTALIAAKVFPTERTEDKRKVVTELVAAAVRSLYVYEVELADARAEIGEPVGFDNAIVYTDGHGRAVRIQVDASWVTWAGGQ